MESAEAHKVESAHGAAAPEPRGCARHSRVVEGLAREDGVERGGGVRVGFGPGVEDAHVVVCGTA